MYLTIDIPVIMDLILIIIVLVIIISIGLILSKPFLNEGEVEKISVLRGNYSAKYEELLKEIKSLESDYETEQIPEKVALKMNHKKLQAAELLRKLSSQPQMAAQRDSVQDFDAVDDGDRHINSLDEPRPSMICPHCGRPVYTGDKFCASCGHRLEL